MSEPANRRIIESLPELVEPRDRDVNSFIHASVLAICVDCGGAFNVERGACPGCASASWYLLHPERVVTSGGGG